MGRGPTNENTNMYFQARKKAATYNERLWSREGAAELLGISVSTLADYELGNTKVVPVDKVVLMADLYNAPELITGYCMRECPVHGFLPLATEEKSLEGIALRLLQNFNEDSLKNIGYADTLYQKKLSEDEVHSAAGVILNEGMRLEALSFKLLELITLDKNDFRLEETRISEIIADCVETAHEAARKHNTEIVYSADEAWVWLEYDLFKTMLLNLIDNAVKSGGSKVEVSGRLISHSIYRIAVSDNGRGIPPEDIERITEAFYMVDKSRSRSEHGAGLGLALVSRIAKLHDTKIHYESESGKGTKVYFDMKAEALDEK